MYNLAQVKAKVEGRAHRSKSEYERSIKPGNWLFYPCDDHVIRVRKTTDDGWRAVLSTMSNRDHGLKACNAPTRAEAVWLILLHMETFAK